MKLLHLSSETGLRGGEHQLLLLARQDKPAISEIFGVPKKSGLYDRLPADAANVPVDCRGFYDLASVLRLRALLRSENIDLVHAHSNRAHKTAIALRPRNRQPLVVSRRNAFRCRGGLIYRAVDRFITVSGAGFQALRDGGVEANRISVIHDAVDEAAMAAAVPERLGIAGDETMVLCVAAFTAEKDHATLLKAWDRIAQSNPKAHLLLAGDGPGRAAMEEQARELPRVRFLGWCEDVIPLIKGADIVTLASLNEGLGSSLCMAQWAGKPVAATSAGGIGEAVEGGKTGLLSPPGDAGALAKNLAALLQDTDLRDGFGKAAAIRARKLFSLRTFTDAHVEIYRQLTGA